MNILCIENAFIGNFAVKSEHCEYVRKINFILK